MPLVVGTTSTNYTGTLYVDGAWTSWNQTAATSTSLWIDWNGPHYVTASIYSVGSNIDVWNSWQTVTTNGTVPTGTSGLLKIVPPVALNPPQRSEEEWAAIRAEHEAARERRDRLQVAARAEASKLLAMVLTAEQLATYQARRYFDVVGSAGGLFRIEHGTSGNIRQRVDGQFINRLCVHPSLYLGAGTLPTEDCLAAQALALMHDELGTIATANVHQGVRHLAAA